MALPSTLPYDRVMVNMEREEVSLGRTKSQLDPRLISTTTGSVENSCHSCLLPFGVLASIIGLVTTSVACAGRFSDTILTVAGGVLLATGLLGVTVSCIWQQYRRRKRCGSWTILTGETQAKKAVIWRSGTKSRARPRRVNPRTKSHLASLGKAHLELIDYFQNLFPPF